MNGLFNGRTAFAAIASISLMAPAFLPAQASAQEGAVKDGSFATTGADAADNEKCEGEGCWGRKRRIRIVQVRPFKKDGRLELGVLGGVIPNDPFAVYGAVGFQMSYYLSESLGIGGRVVLPLKSDTGLGDDIFDDYPNIDSRRALEQTLFYHLNIFEWTPIVGKMAFYSIGTVHFDIGINAGFGLLHTEAPQVDLAGQVTEDVEGDKKFLFTTGGGFRFYVGDWGAVRFDVSQYFYPKPPALGGLSHPTMLSIGFSTFLPFSPGGA